MYFGPTDIDIATVANPAYESYIKMTSNQTEDSLQVTPVYKVMYLGSI